MKTVAIDTSPMESGHSVRGIGSYTRQLVSEFKKSDNWPIKFEFFSDATPPPADLIHYPYFDLFFKTLPAKKTIARGVTIHDVIPLIFPQYFPAGPKGYISLFFQKRALKNCNFVICDSKASKADIINKLSYPAQKIHVVYLAAGENFKKIEDQQILEHTRKKFDLPKEFVLFVGDVNWNKNLEGIAGALAKIKIPAVLVGQAIGRLNLTKRIIKTGYVRENELVAIYNLAQVTILPSFYEGFGLPVLESMACGTPVVCSNAGSLAEIAGPAIICDPADPFDIAAKIEQVLNMPKQKGDKLAQLSQEHSAKFSWQKTARETVNIYKKFL